jgi:hypothetical protein
MMACDKTHIYESTDEGLVAWHQLDGLNGEHIIWKPQYMVMPKQDMGCQYLNQHVPSVSEVLACNCNVSVGDPSHTYYSTLYSAKTTQKEDRENFQRVATSVGRRIIKAIELSRANATGEETESANEKVLDPDYVEGLGRVLTGVNAALNRNVVSSTMAHLLICQGGSRFVFSHPFKPLLLSQMKDVLEGNESNFILRRNRDENNEVKQWPDSSADDYRFRDDDPEKDLDNMSFYEFTMMYEKNLILSKK